MSDTTLSQHKRTTYGDHFEKGNGRCHEHRAQYEGRAHSIALPKQASAPVARKLLRNVERKPLGPLGHWVHGNRESEAHLHHERHLDHHHQPRVVQIERDNGRRREAEERHAEQPKAQVERGDGNKGDGQHATVFVGSYHGLVDGNGQIDTLKREHGQTEKEEDLRVGGLSRGA